MAVPPPSVPDVLLNVLHRPQYKPKNPDMPSYTHGGPKPLNGHTTAAELLTHSKAFDEIMSYNHKLRAQPIVVQPISSGPTQPLQYLTSVPTPAGYPPAPEHTKRDSPTERQRNADSPLGNNASFAAESGTTHTGPGNSSMVSSYTSGPTQATTATQSANTSTSRHPIPEPPPQIAAASLPGDAMTLYAKNIEYYNSLVDLQKRLGNADSQIASLQDQLQACCEEYVPPRNFLPPGFYEEHKPIIDAINDYYVLYRVATAQKLLRRRSDSNKGSGLDLYGASDFIDEHGNLIASAVTVSRVDSAEMKEEMLCPNGDGSATNQYLRERVADLTAKIRVQQQRMGTGRR